MVVLSFLKKLFFLVIKPIDFEKCIYGDISTYVNKICDIFLITLQFTFVFIWFVKD